MLYIIYKVCGNEGVLLPEPLLYAMTDNKDFYKEFIRQRNMDLFKITKKDLTEEEESDFFKHHSSYYLKDYSYADGDKSSYTIVSSLQEYSHVVHSETEAAYEIARSFKKSYHNLLSDEMKSAMKNMMYDEVCMYVDFVDKYYLSSDMMMSEDRPRFDTSAFRIFLYLYGNTLNIKD